MQDHKVELVSLLRQFEAGLARSQAVSLPPVAAPEKLLLEVQALIRETEQVAATRRTNQILLEIKQLLADWQAQWRQQ